MHIIKSTNVMCTCQMWMHQVQELFILKKKKSFKSFFIHHIPTNVIVSICYQFLGCISNDL